MITVHSKVARVTFAAGPCASLPLDADTLLAGARLRAVAGPVPRVAVAGVRKGASSVSRITAITAAKRKYIDKDWTCIHMPLSVT